MKNLFKTIILLYSISSFSQVGTVVPLNTFYQNIQSGTYRKDINNELDPFVGTWTMIKDNIKYTLVFQKMQHLLVTYSSDFYNYEDRLVCKYETVDLNTNTIIYSTMNATLYDDFDIESLGGVSNGELEFDFYDTPRCNRSMEFRLYKMKFQPGTTIPYQVSYYNFGSDGYFPENCPYTNMDAVPFPLPLGSLVLTKQP